MKNKSTNLLTNLKKGQNDKNDKNDKSKNNLIIVVYFYINPTTGR